MTQTTTSNSPKRHIHPLRRHRPLSHKPQPSIRTSQSTTVPSTEPIVGCIQDRALAFQGYDVPASHLEPIQLVKYSISERYHFHTDWFTDPSHFNGAGNRVSSLFGYVYVDNDTAGGGTNFPHLQALADEMWCEEGIVDCDEEWEHG